MLMFFSSVMSGSEFIAQRKLAFHVLGSHTWPSTYFPADIEFLNWSLPCVVLAGVADRLMSCSPVWMAHNLNRLASFSISQPCLAACFQGIENVVLSCKNTNGNSQYNFSEESSARPNDGAAASGPLTWSTHLRPSMVLELIILSSHGLILILDTGIFAWNCMKCECQTTNNSKGSSASAWRGRRRESSSWSGHAGGLVSHQEITQVKH